MKTWTFKQYRAKNDPLLCPHCHELEAERDEVVFGSDDIGCGAYYHCTLCGFKWIVWFSPYDFTDLTNR